MSRSQLVAEHLPLLRRYARALTGSQASGDAYVGAMLEALLQDPSLLDEQHGPRAGLFRLFTQIWNSVAINEDADVTTLPMPSERRLSNITPLPRQACLPDHGWRPPAIGQGPGGNRSGEPLKMYVSVQK